MFNTIKYYIIIATQYLFKIPAYFSQIYYIQPIQPHWYYCWDNVWNIIILILLPKAYCFYVFFSYMRLKIKKRYIKYYESIRITSILLNLLSQYFRYASIKILFILNSLIINNCSGSLIFEDFNKIKYTNQTHTKFKHIRSNYCMLINSKIQISKAYARFLQMWKE